MMSMMESYGEGFAPRIENERCGALDSNQGMTRRR
jgi:hypothetical protein